VVPAPRDRPTALLIDLDGVIRHFDPAARATAEERHGVAPGRVWELAVDPARLVPAVTGQVTRAQWLEGVAEAIADEVGGIGPARSLIVEWDAYRGSVAPAALAFVRETRQSGIPVALATNATDGLDLELATLGIEHDFDVVVSSARVGVAKPHPDFYEAACVAVRTAPGRCLFVDDVDRNVRGARAAGLLAHRYAGPDDLRYLREALAPA
jgi:putative hydrolase of the HAD superfamily